MQPSHPRSLSVSVVGGAKAGQPKSRGRRRGRAVPSRATNATVGGGPVRRPVAQRRPTKPAANANRAAQWAWEDRGKRGDGHRGHAQRVLTCQVDKLFLKNALPPITQTLENLASEDHMLVRPQYPGTT